MDDNPNSTVDEDVGETKITSISCQTKFPFHIKWSLIDNKKPYRNNIFYKTKISNIISSEHTCLMSQISYRHALKSSNGHKKIDLSACNTAVDILKMDHSMPARMLRPMLKNVLPSHTHISGKYIDNFRRRDMMYHAKNPNALMVTMEGSIALTKDTQINKSNFLGMNDPVVQINFRAMYGSIMQNDSSNWSAIQFLKKCKESISGFDYKS